MANNQRGQTITELIVVVLIIGWITAFGGSALESARRGVALAAATAELRGLFDRVRILAIARDRNLALRFRPEGEQWSWSIYEDGDGDGVRNDDISRGVDRLIQRPRLFQHPPARIGVPSGTVLDPMNGRLLSLRLPVRFNNSMLCSFSRSGEATNGSVVLTDGKHATIIQIVGKSARIRVLKWNGKRWR